MLRRAGADGSDEARRRTVSRRRVIGYGGALLGAAGGLSMSALRQVAAIASTGGAPAHGGRQTVGGGTLSAPAAAPSPAMGTGGADFVPVKNWDFGQCGTIRDTADLIQEFQFHDQFGTIDNGGNYGAVIVAPNSATALAGQPVQSPSDPVRLFTADSLRTFLVPLDGASVVTPTLHNVGCGSIQAKWTLPTGGSLLGQDLLWETRVRYLTPPYFWFALWTSGN